MRTAAAADPQTGGPLGARRSSTAAEVRRDPRAPQHVSRADPSVTIATLASQASLVAGNDLNPLTRPRVQPGNLAPWQTSRKRQSETPFNLQAWINCSCDPSTPPGPFTCPSLDFTCLTHVCACLTHHHHRLPFWIAVSCSVTRAPWPRGEAQVRHHRWAEASALDKMSS